MSWFRFGKTPRSSNDPDDEDRGSEPSWRTIGGAVIATAGLIQAGQVVTDLTHSEFVHHIVHDFLPDLLRYLT